MSIKLNKRKWVLGAAAAGVLAVAGIAGIWLFTECDICEAANQIILRGTVAANCSINVTPDNNAQNLVLTSTPAQPVVVGTVTQSCNKKAGYTLTVASANCSSGAKLIDPSPGGENLPYSVQFTNPTTGNSTSPVTGLLASACDNPVGRDVSNAKINSELSTVYVAYTGNPNLAAGTYQDTLTLSMNVR